MQPKINVQNYVTSFTPYIYESYLLTALKNHRHHHKRTMRFLSVCTICVLCTLAVASKDADETVQNEGVLMKNISDLHFQLFSSIQKKAKMIKVSKTKIT